MAKRGVNVPSITPEWDPNSKEPWHFDFEKEPVNDEKWSCIVTAAIQAEAQDEEIIQIYMQCVNTGLRKAIKIITMNDVISLLKSSQKEEKITKAGKAEKGGRKNGKPSSPSVIPIVELAAKYATFTDVDCKLPSNLMAAVIKYLILRLKEENILRKRIEAVRERKIREQNLKAKFIRDLRPYEMSQGRRKTLNKVPPNILELEEPINDEPAEGPYLYVLLTDFYDVFVIPELLSMCVPFVALLKISTVGFGTSGIGKTSHTSVTKLEAYDRKKSAVASFWENLSEQCFALESTAKFKTVVMMQYQASCKSTEPKTHSSRIIFDQLTWMQYSAYCIYRQHQKYLQEVHVQRLILSLEPLDLSKCEMYNKLCDALVTGEPLTPLLVLYAIVEQVVVGVPETENVVLEHTPELSDFFFNKSETSVQTEEKSLIMPCKKCMNKLINKNVCEKVKCNVCWDHSSEKDEWGENSDKISENSSSRSQNEEISPETLLKPLTFSYSEPEISKPLLTQVIREKKTEMGNDKKEKWKAPSLCFYGDSVFLQTYHCDRRLLHPENVVERFLKRSELSRIWTKYPELPSGERAFCNFHFHRLQKISNEREEQLKLKIYFTLSMKLIGITKSYLYKGEDENTSDMTSATGKEKLKLSRVKFGTGMNAFTPSKGEEINFNNYFFKTFIVDTFYRKPRRNVMKIDNTEHLMGSSVKTDSHTLHKVKSQCNMSLMVHLSSGTSYGYSYRQNLENAATNSSVGSCTNEKVLTTLYSLLDCFEISNVTEPHVLSDKDDYLNLVQDFKYYEKLEPKLMLQRLLEAQENYNTTQCSYFAPTDSVIIIIYNDFDHRGIFYSESYGALPTPVALRDFYAYVYPEISDWLMEENEEHIKFTNELDEKAKTEKELKDLDYVANLKRLYCEMSPEKREEFLDTSDEIESEPQIGEKELGELPLRPKPNCPNKISFVTMNFMDVRVETNTKIHEFHSRDGTEVNMAVETWLHAPLKLLKLNIKRSNLLLYYSQWLSKEEIETSFTFKTTSDIIFAFRKSDRSERLNYHLTISWPTGLIINPVSHNSNIYVKQSYLKPYRKGWAIEDESSRCFIKNGQVIIFKESGDCEILSGNGTKCTFCESTGVLRYEIMSTGELWEVRTKGPCKNKRKLVGTSKVFIGVDPKTQETFYKREDGMFCMLWPNGTLVTTYPDGTKITSTPLFDEKEVSVEWTTEEKLYYIELESKHKSEQSVHEPRSRTILRNSSSPKTTERKTFFIESFLSISCMFLMEHPKYSTVHFNPDDSTVRVTTPEHLSVFIYPEGNYEIQQERNFLKVNDSIVEFYTNCNDCDDRSMATLYLDSNEVLCSCIDFFQKTFTVFKNGESSYQEYCREFYDEDTLEHSKELGKSHSGLNKCVHGHTKNLASTQRCFAFERDLSGVEFLHSDSLAFFCYQLPEETYYDINADDLNNLSHTFSSPYYKIGYEKWLMDYEDKSSSLPTNLSKKDLKECGVRNVSKNLFRYPFPKHESCRDPLQTEKLKRNVSMPKLIVTRTVKCWSQEPQSVMGELQKYVATYQKRARGIWNSYKNHKDTGDRSQDSRYEKMRLRKIALTLSQTLQMYPHLCTKLPSTERDIHYFGHFINFVEELKVENRSEMLPDCKQIPSSLQRPNDFPSIYEEDESPHVT